MCDFQRGISKKKKGDLCTPKGILKFKAVFYRKDRIPKIKTRLKKIAIKKSMGWCDEPKSKSYNKLIKFPFSYNAEKLYKRSSIYDIVLITSYNLRPTIKNKGSAIFLHVAKKNYTPTKGCIAVSKKILSCCLNSLIKKQN